MDDMKTLYLNNVSSAKFNKVNLISSSNRQIILSFSLSYHLIPRRSFRKKEKSQKDIKEGKKKDGYHDREEKKMAIMPYGKTETNP